MKKVVLLLTFLMTLAVLAGCSSENMDASPSESPADPASGSTADQKENLSESLFSPETQTYTLDCGATVTALAGMEPTEIGGFTEVITSDDLALFLLAEDKATFGFTDWTLEDYARVIASTNNLSQSFSTDEWGYLSSSYTTEVEGEEYYYYLTVRDGGTHFWLCQFACAEKDLSLYATHIPKWASTLTVAAMNGQTSSAELGEEVYQLDCGMQITAGSGMTSRPGYSGFTEFLYGPEYALVLMEENKAEYGMNSWTLEDYAAAVSEANGLEALSGNSYGSLHTTFVEENEGISYFYYLTVSETEESFWLCQFYCPENLTSSYADSFAKWSATLIPIA